ncbi:MAG TPA: hypothetical protein VLB44_10080 [Kofleriaceae bacterium]|nr:hypothetical protein [Kofleriaceae bacterium]
MRIALLALLVVGSTAAAAPAPGWSDVPALVASATAPVDGELRTCRKTKPPWSIAMIATRDPKSGATAVAMPMPPVGIRGFTPEEKCLMAVIAKISLPALPAGVARVILGHTVVADGATVPVAAKAFDDWRDLPAALATVIDAKRRTSLAACDAKPRTVRLILDLSHGKTRVWLPAWQFHAANGDGSTPPAQRRVKACLTKAIWKPPVLPQDMAEIELALDTAP